MGNEALLLILNWQENLEMLWKLALDIGLI